MCCIQSRSWVAERSWHEPALQESEDRQRFAADAYADENSRLIAMLTRHLADEEDLIIPLILDRGDRALDPD